MPPIRIVLADDHSILRKGIRSILEELPGVEVVAEAADGREALELIKQLEPGLVFMDIAMPGMNGLEAAARLTRDFPQIRVIILSMHANEEYVWHALRAGAAGYLLKDAGKAEIELAVQAVSRGETYLTPAVSKHVVADFIRRFGNDACSLDMLTPRQREILQLIAEGRSTKEIAVLLKVSPKTIETHRAQLMERLDIHDVAGLVRYAVRVGIVPAEA